MFIILPSIGIYVTSVTSCSFIAPNSMYTYRVRGNTSAGYSDFSNPENFETDEDGKFLNTCRWI